MFFLCLFAGELNYKLYSIPQARLKQLIGKRYIHFIFSNYQFCLKMFKTFNFVESKAKFL